MTDCSGVIPTIVSVGAPTSGARRGDHRIKRGDGDVQDDVWRHANPLLPVEDDRRWPGSGDRPTKAPNQPYTPPC
jgi:hypothetical protein